MKTTLVGGLAVGLALAWCGAAQAGTILLLSNTGWDIVTQPPVSPRSNPDQQFVDWVTGTLGHTVVKQYVSTATNKAQIDGWIAQASADLVIIGPRNTSHNYQTKDVNQVAKPLILMIGHCVTANRLNWVPNQEANSVVPDNTPNSSMTIVNASHPWMAGVTSGVFYDYSNDGNGDTRGIRQAGYTSTNMLGNGTIIARGSGGTWNGFAEIVEWASGVLPFAGSTAGIFGERRALFMGTDWARINGTDVSNFTHDYTANAKLALHNVIDNMIPEPATMALLGLGLGAILRRRRAEKVTHPNPQT